MKKTIIALMALAGVAAAETLTISNAGNTASSTGSWFESLSASAVITSGSSANFTATDYTKSFYAVGTNVGNGSQYTYTLTFTLEQDVTLETLSADIFFFNSSGGAQGKDRTVNYSMSVYQEGVSDSLFSVANESITSTQGAVDSNGSVVYFSSAYDENGVIAKSSDTDINKGPRYVQPTQSLTTPITLDAGTTYKLNIDIAVSDGLKGTFVGIGNIAMAGQLIPEPTTATLSLLALAGLAARRRRR